MRKRREAYNIITLGLVGTTLLSGSLLISSNSSASDSGIDNVSITIPVTCTMVGTGMNSHTATIENGTYRGDDVNGIGIGETTLKAYCNDTSGFSIYAIGYTNEEYGNTVLKSTTLGDTYNIITGTNTGPVGTEDISNWSMKLKAVSGTYTPTIENGFSNYSNVPTTYTKVATKSSGTDMGSNAEGSSIKSTYAAYISKTQPSDTYEGKVKYTLVHPAGEDAPLSPLPAKPGKIVYHSNASSVQGQMGDQSANNNTNVTLWASNFKRTGYGFAGWNDKYDYSGTFYGPNQTITAPDDVETNGLSLYAVWIKSAGTIQNWNGCSSLAQGSTTALTDERDGNTYAVAKLADGKCWTIENLRLDNTPELTATNTHNPSLPLNNSWYYKNQQGTLTTSNHLSIASDPTSTNPDTAWCGIYNSSDCVDQSMLATNNTTLFTNNTSSSYDASSNVYSYGNYYNWYSATAGHGKYGSNYEYGYVAPGDICPAGWHLPTGRGATSAEFGALDVAMGGTGAYQSGDAGIAQSVKWRSYPNNFIYSGYVSGSSVSSRSSSGGYWSASGNNSYDAYHLYLYSSYVYPGTSGNFKYLGRLVRCVAGV